MNALGQLVLGAGALALLMAVWSLVQQHWLRLIAPQYTDALAARRTMQQHSDDPLNDGCCACDNSANCHKGGP